MKGLNLLFSKNYWLYIFSLKNTTSTILETLGIIWLLVDATNYFSSDLSDFFKSHKVWLLVFGIVWVIYQNWPKTEFCYKLKDRDRLIQVSIGDLFKYEGDLIIPFNTSLDTAFEDNLVSRKSTQGQFTIKYFKEPRYLEQDIKATLEPNFTTTELPHKVKGNKFKCEIGTIIKLKLPEEKFAYLMASSNMNNDGVASTNFDNILISLANLWEFISEKGELSNLNIPVIGTGRGRIKETRETIIKAIIHSFISSTSSSNSKGFCNKLNIVVHPKDFREHQINMRELKDFLRLKTRHYQNENNEGQTGHSIG